eukprot:sb/3476884/
MYDPLCGGSEVWWVVAWFGGWCWGLSRFFGLAACFMFSTYIQNFLIFLYFFVFFCIFCLEKNRNFGYFCVWSIQKNTKKYKKIGWNPPSTVSETRLIPLKHCLAKLTTFCESP